MLKTGSLGRFDALAISCRFIQVDLVICVTLIASKAAAALWVITIDYCIDRVFRKFVDQDVVIFLL